MITNLSFLKDNFRVRKLFFLPQETILLSNKSKKEDNWTLYKIIFYWQTIKISKFNL